MLPAGMADPVEPEISFQVGVEMTASVVIYNLPTSVPTYNCVFPAALIELQNALGAPFAAVPFTVTVVANVADVPTYCDKSSLLTYQ